MRFSIVKGSSCLASERTRGKDVMYVLGDKLGEDLIERVIINGIDIRDSSITDLRH